MPNEPARDPMAVLRISTEECAISNDIDDARHAAGEVIELGERGRGEDIARRARDAQAVAHVSGGLGI